MMREWKFHPVKFVFATGLLVSLLHFGILLSWPQSEVNLWLLGGERARIISGLVDLILVAVSIYGCTRTLEQINAWLLQSWWRWVKLGICGVLVVLFGIVFLPLSIKHYQLVAATRGVFLQFYALGLSGLIYSGLALLSFLIVEGKAVKNRKSKWRNFSLIFIITQLFYFELLLSGWLWTIGFFK